jgi:hypothetical protein
VALAPFLVPIERSIRVAYRASAEPQQLYVDLVLAEPDPNALAPARVRTLIEAINAGAAGGAEFAPTVGAARLVSGAQPGLDPAAWDHGPSYRWVIEVRGVSPRFLRSVVEVLAIAAAPVATVAIGIAGVLRPDESALSVHTAQLLAWCAEPTAYPARWPALPFEVHEETIPRGAALRVAFGDDAGPDQVEILGERLAVWGFLTTTCPSLARDSIGGRTFIDRLGVTLREYSRFVEEFDLAQEVAAAPLFNLLARFHAEVVPISRVDLRMP